MFSSLTCMFSFQTCLQSGGKKCIQLLNTLFTVYIWQVYLALWTGAVYLIGNQQYMLYLTLIQQNILCGCQKPLFLLWNPYRIPLNKAYNLRRFVIFLIKISGVEKICKISPEDFYDWETFQLHVTNIQGVQKVLNLFWSFLSQKFLFVMQHWQHI